MDVVSDENLSGLIELSWINNKANLVINQKGKEKKVEHFVKRKDYGSLFYAIMEL